MGCCDGKKEEKQDTTGCCDGKKEEKQDTTKKN